jgi:hypothetical protein
MPIQSDPDKVRKETIGTLNNSIRILLELLVPPEEIKRICNSSIQFSLENFARDHAHEMTESFADALRKKI